jgi:hypothetical protein
MLDQLFELSRKAAESSVQIHQVMVKQWTQNLLSRSPASPTAGGISTDWGGMMRKRWVELVLDMLNKQREQIDATYNVGIRTIEQVARVSEAGSAEASVHAVKDAWARLYEGYKTQAESQFRDLQTWATKSFEGASAHD